MQPIQIRLTAVTLLLTVGFLLRPSPDSLLPAIAQTAPDREAEGDRGFSQEANHRLQTAKQHFC